MDFTIFTTQWILIFAGSYAAAAFIILLLARFAKLDVVQQSGITVLSVTPIINVLFAISIIGLSISWVFAQVAARIINRCKRGK